MKKFPCDKCEKVCKSKTGLNNHQNHQHPLPAEPEPNTETTFACENLGLTNHTLLNGSKLEVGDVFYRIQKCVIKRITKTEGSDDVKVGYELTKQTWQKNKPL